MSDLAVPETAHRTDLAPLELSDDELLDAMVFEALVLGATFPRPLTLATNLSRPQDLNRIKWILNGPKFATALQRARRDMVVYTTDQIKAWLPRLTKEMLTVALQNEDLRCKVVALKDLKDRGGMSATQKLSLSTPSAYQQAIAELIDQPTDEPVAPIEMED